MSTRPTQQPRSSLESAIAKAGNCRFTCVRDAGGSGIYLSAYSAVMMGLDTLCPEHGWLSHVAIHEAAHAVIAHARGIPFLDISITNPAKLQDVLNAASAVAGGLRLTTADHSSWIPQRSNEALDMLLAGAQGEIWAFGHSLPKSFSGDLSILRQGMGWLDGAPPDARDALIQSTERLRQEIPERYSAIRRVAQALTCNLNTDENGRYIDFNETLSLSADEVADLIENT